MDRGLIYTLLLCLTGVGQVHPIGHGDYEVVGVSCEPDEQVSCMLVECPPGFFCPAANYCYNPKCVCRKGYRRVRGVCVPKRVSMYMETDALQKALLETSFSDKFTS